MSSELSPRIAKVAKFLNIEKESLEKCLVENGITNDSDGLIVLDSDTTTIEDLVGIISVLLPGVPPLKVKTAAGILKERMKLDSSSLKEKTSSDSGTISEIVEVLKSNRPIQQWDDENLLARFFDQGREEEVAQELNRRAKCNPFIVLKSSEKGYKPGEEEIDVASSLVLLKDARKKKISNVLNVPGGFRPVYKITEFNLLDNIVDLCPFCEGALYRDYCDKCTISLSNTGNEERAFINLIVKSGANLSMGDKKGVVAIALNGINNLKKEWPSIIKQYDELKAIDSLPRLRIYRDRPTDIKEPFYQNGLRSFGIRKY